MGHPAGKMNFAFESRLQVGIGEVLIVGMERNLFIETRGVRVMESKRPLMTIEDMMVESMIDMQMQESLLTKEIIIGLVIRTGKSKRRRL